MQPMPHHGVVWYMMKGQKKCRLEQTACIARGCRIKTFLWPLCSHHARTLVGLALRTSATPGRGCGLFATRNFPKDYVLAPYLGHVINERASRNIDGAYLIPNPLNQKEVIDAACRRGYAAMCNHNSSSSVNCQLTIISNRMRNPKSLKGSRQKQQYLGWHIPGVFFHPSLMHRPIVWLVSTKQISAGEELCINYGEHADHINAVQHMTVPSLCHVNKSRRKT